MPDTTRSNSTISRRITFRPQGKRVVRAVDEVSLRVDAGETLGIVGESGSGKSTLALTILRVLPPAARIVSGRMMFEGEDLVQKSDDEMREIRGKRIAMVLQDPMASLNPLFTIGNQVAEPIRVHENARAQERLDPRTRAAEGGAHPRRRSTRVKQYPHEMSGGMRQRIVGAIGISCEPRLLIADEPTTSLDLTIQAQYLNLMRDLQRAHGLALIFITHNLGIVAKMCDKLAVMYAGRVVEYGPGVADLQLAGASLHQGAAELDPAADRQRPASDRDRGPAARSGRAAARAVRSPPRCTSAFDRCHQQAPPEVSPAPGRTVRCWLGSAQADALRTAGMQTEAV